jgi:hypothetical protein
MSNLTASRHAASQAGIAGWFRRRRKMSVAYGEIGRVLGAARRRQGGVVLATGLTVGLAGALAALFAGALALHLGAGPAARTAALVAALLAALLAAGWSVRELLRTALRPSNAARVLGAADVGLGSDLLTSIELHRDYARIEQDQQFSMALVDEQIGRTARRVAEVDLRQRISSRPAQMGALVLAAVVLAHLAGFALAGKSLLRAYGRLAGTGVEGKQGPRVEPITGDIELTYLFPAYMGRPTKTLSGTGGEVSAPKGTEVRLKTRADRPVTEGELAVTSGDPAAARHVALQVSNQRDLSGSFVVQDGGSYRFRFLQRGKEVAVGPPIAITVEPDAFPEVKILAPGAQVEVDAKAHVRIDWSASDDYGLQDLTLVVKPPSGQESRKTLHTFAGGRRESGGVDLDLGPLALGEGDRLLYFLEVRDNDAISGPKRAASATQVVKIYSEAEHRRAALDKAQALWEELVQVLAGWLELPSRRQAIQTAATQATKQKAEPAPGQPSAAGQEWALAEALDTRTKRLHEALAEAAAALRKDRSAPREISRGLANAASGIRQAEQRLTTTRQALMRQRAQGRDDANLAWSVGELEAELVRELEKDVLYLEMLFDKSRADDLVRMAKELAGRRRDLAGLVEKYKAAPTDEGKKQLLAQIDQMKRRMQDLLARMRELARGLNDEHMNAEAMAELAKSQDLSNGLSKVEQMIAKGDLDSALKELDRMGNSMQQMLSQLQRTSGAPDAKNAALAKRMMALKRELDALRDQQQQLADEAERARAEYRKKAAERAGSPEALAKRLAGLAHQASQGVNKAAKGVSPRTEDDFSQTRDRLEDLERALAMKDFDASLETVRRALPAMQRLAAGLEEEAGVAERFPGINDRDPVKAREAQREVASAIGPASKVKDELEKLFPDPRNLLSKAQQQRLESMARKQLELSERAGNAQQQLDQLMHDAPIFPSSSGQIMGEARGHMYQAAGELTQKNPQRGHQQQQLALDSLDRLKRGFEELAKKAGSGGEGGGFPFPMADAGPSGGEEGEQGEMSEEKVEIPGADAYQAPAEFRKDLLEAMKQGAPESYKGEVQRYYQELVK